MSHLIALFINIMLYHHVSGPHFQKYSIALQKCTKFCCIEGFRKSFGPWKCTVDSRKCEYAIFHVKSTVTFAPLTMSLMSCKCCSALQAPCLLHLEAIIGTIVRTSFLINKYKKKKKKKSILNFDWKMFQPGSRKEALPCSAIQWLRLRKKATGGVRTIMTIK